MEGSVQNGPEGRHEVVEDSGQIREMEVREKDKLML
jgi:hypothetical protein